MRSWILGWVILIVLWWVTVSAAAGVVYFICTGEKWRAVISVFTAAALYGAYGGAHRNFHDQQERAKLKRREYDEP